MTPLRLTLLMSAFVLLTSACKKETPAPQTQPAPQEQAPQAEPAAPAAPEASASKASVNPMLYRVKGDKGTLYMLGTIHMGVNPKTFFSEEVWSLFDASRSFVMETDLTNAQAAMFQRMAQPKGQTLEAQLGPAGWKALDKLLDDRAEQYNSVKPWVVVSLILLKMLPKDADPTASMDQQLLDKARSQGKKLGYLEPPDFQLEILEKTMTADDLKEMVTDFEKQKKELDDMVTAYVKGDAETLERISFKELDKKPDRYELLFFKRNRAWIPELEVYLKQEGDTFAAFGAGHLFGDKGVLKLLEANGYKVERYPFK